MKFDVWTGRGRRSWALLPMVVLHYTTEAVPWPGQAKWRWMLVLGWGVWNLCFALTGAIEPPKAIRLQASSVL